MESEVAIGVLNLDAVPERIKREEDTPGCLRNDKTFDFRLKRETVRGSIPERFQEEDPELVPHFVEAAKKLEARGVKAIVGDCGYIVKYQQDIANEVSVPVVTSNLLIVPLVYQMLDPKKKVGILTARTDSSKRLAERHFNAAGWSSQDIPIVLKRFAVDLMPTEKMVQLAKELVEENPDIGALVFECSVTPPHARAVQKATGLPVFDITTLVKLVHSAIDPQDYSQE
jgi:hypothetical protein